MESGTDLTLVATIIGTGVTVLVALLAFGVFFLRRMDTLIQDAKTELRSEIQGVRTDLGPRIDGVNARVDQVLLAMVRSASEQVAASNPATRVEKRPPAA